MEILNVFGSNCGGNQQHGVDAKVRAIVDDSGSRIDCVVPGHDRIEAVRKNRRINRWTDQDGASLGFRQAGHGIDQGDRCENSYVGGDPDDNADRT